MFHKVWFYGAFCTCLIVSNAVAVPTVKRLGTSNSYSGTTNISSVKTSGARTSRAPSMRSVSSNKNPVTITKTVSTKANDNVTTSRLAVGKYLHNKGVESGVIKPATSSAEIQSDDITNLTNRVVQLENKIDEKQQELSAGDGIIIENDVISVDSAIHVLPDKVDAIEETIGDASSGLVKKVNDLENQATAVYTGGTGISVNENNQIGLDGLNGADDDKIYVFQNGEWVELPVVNTWN